MTQNTLLQPPPAQRRLACRCEEHLRREEAHLRTLVDFLGRARAACLAGRLDELDSLLQHHKELGQTEAPLTQERERLRQELASFLDVPLQRVNLTFLLSSLPPGLGAPLEPQAARLRALLREAEQLTHHNAALLGYSLSFLQRLFHTLAGRCGVERYSPQGRREDGTPGNLLQARRG